MEKPLKILIVEDNDFFRNLLADHLQNQGYEVFSAADFQSGKSAVEDFKPERLILDIAIPGGGNGPRLYQFARQTLGEIPTVFITGIQHRPEQRQVEIPAEARVLYKPFPLHELDEVLHQVLENDLIDPPNFHAA